MAKTRKLQRVLWSKDQPTTHERTVMLENCGKMCFLGSNKSFPICKRKTCKISKKGVYAAYVRARQYRKKSSRYYKIAKKAKTLLHI